MLKKRKSLRIAIVINSVVISLIIFTALIFGSRQYIFTNQEEDRLSHINSIGEMFITMLERPHSEGELAEVERMIQTKNLPEFVSYISVYRGNEQIAKRKGVSFNICSKTKDHRYEFLDEIDKKSMGHILIRESLCSLQDRQSKLQNLTYILILIFAVSFIIVTFFSTSFVFKPLERVIKKSSGSDDFNSDVIAATPTEIKPLVKKLFESINYKTRADLQKEIVHNVHSKLTTLGIILKNRADDEEDEALQYFKDVEKSINALRRPTEELKDFKGDVEEILLNSLISGVCSEKQKEFNLKNLDIKITDISLGNFKLYTHFNKSFLKSTLENIINNAADAITSNGVIQVVLSGGDDEHTVKVIDNGSGIKKELWEKIFNKDFTLKDTGTGSGLYQAQRIKELGGDVFIEHSEINKGTSISIILPSYKPESRLESPDITVDAQLLILDDERNLLKRLKKELQKKDVRVATFTNSNMFLDKLKLFSKDIPIVIDLQLMPEGKTGDQVAKVAKEKGYKNLTLYSGESLSEIDKKYMEPFKGFIPKKANSIITDLMKLVDI